MIKKHNAIICAAIRNPITGTVIKGHRHFDEIMAHSAQHSGEDPIKFQEQGFIDMYGDFVDQKEALKIVKENGQFFDHERNVSSDERYSEGIY